MIRDLSVDYPDFLIASSEWYTVLKVKDYFENPGDHADGYLEHKGKKQYPSVLLSEFHNAYGYKTEVPVVPDFAT